jgi:hypothetical protein
MNDKRNEDVPMVPASVAAAAVEEAETAAGLVAELQDSVDSLEAELESANAKIAGLGSVAPAGNAELRALAGTIRQAMTRGHPDAPKHVETLLKALGA